MKRDLDNFLRKHDQLQQSDNLAGIFKALVVDNRDPFMSGKVRVHIYGVHSDYKDTKITQLPWAEPILASDGSFVVPDRFSRVWVMYEGGDKYSPIYFGSWKPCPMGAGKLPFSSRVGSELRPEGWSSADLVPDSKLVCSTGEGSALWMKEMLLGEDHGVASSINLMDTGSKYFRISSTHVDKEPWVPKDSRAAKQESLEDEEGDPFKPIRTGFDEPIDSDGSIELGFTGLTQSWTTSKDKVTIASLNQVQDEDDGVAELLALDGQILAMQQKSSQMAMMGEAVFLSAARGVFVDDLLTPPIRWD